MKTTIAVKVEPQGPDPAAGLQPVVFDKKQKRREKEETVDLSDRLWMGIRTPVIKLESRYLSAVIYRSPSDTAGSFACWVFYIAYPPGCLLLFDFQ